MKKGFTLVELSIVLVIIGLLIGGILVGQSLIDSAKTQRAVRDLQQYNIAILNFKGKFKKLPGDNIIFGGIGNMDGNVDYDEKTYVWSDLSGGVNLKNSKGGNYVPGWTNNSYPRFNLDQNIADSPFLEFAAYGGIMTYEYRSYGAAPLKPLVVMAFDTKLDDGKALTGNFLGMSGEEDTIGICLNGAEYNVAGVDYSCKFIVKNTAL